MAVKDGFFKTTAGQQGTPDSVNGLFLCRGDVTAVVCQECVTAAAKEITRHCPKDTESLIWYDDCMLRYSNDTFDIKVPGTYMEANKSIADSDQDLFNQWLARLLNDLAKKAANSPSEKKKFATGEENFTMSQTLYGLAQCTPDLSAFDCNMCLQSAIAYFPICCDGQQGARALFPGCNMRYELYPFYNITASSSTPVVPPRSGGSQISLVVGIIVPVVAVALFVLGCCFLRKRASKKKHNTAMHDGIDLTDVESLHFDLATIEDATNRFSDEMKIGQGGFGVVYKGILTNRLEIAVKRLAATSSQDFGMAKTFGVDQTEVNTSRIAGTYGYMSPEYAMRGQYSVKSDVFSFGVLVLEIISGRKNTEFYQSQHADDLLSYAWKNWSNQTPSELLDPTVRDCYSRNEVIRCIQIGLLCVQENPADRPSMANIVLVLNSYSVTLQLPRQPASFLRGRTPDRLRNDLESDQSSASSAILWSVNDSSITQVYPR
ncbi:hypothetical protein L6164_032159 [Bauhinia variegata]|uniref:Uncharacterized protein n=1 Tax=Bauhinia variegata TaxID=167791 RepID=A0ACB9KMT0_BAUVA|nr:hypothetical protein L6164_032159 [Bauhinia variegata]